MSNNIIFVLMYHHHKLLDLTERGIRANPSSCTMALGSAEPLTENSIRNHLGGKGRPTRKADNLMCEPISLEDVGISMSHTPMGLHRLLQG
jgi:hypothetical protein